MNYRWKLGILGALVCVQAAGARGEAPRCATEADPESVRIEWTAFKTTQKAAVKGSLAKIQWSKPLRAATPEDVLALAAFKIDGASVASGDAARDSNLVRYFFRKLKGGPGISGSVVKVEPNKNVLRMRLRVGRVDRIVPMEYRLEGEKFEATGRIHLHDFNASSALDQLHQACKGLHQGPDGVSKTWPEVDLRVTAAFKTVCPEP